MLHAVGARIAGLSAPHGGFARGLGPLRPDGPRTDDNGTIRGV